LTGGKALANAEVSLYRANGELFDASKFSQSNPKITSKEGYYGWMLPEGKYYIIVQRDGYFDYRSPTLDIVQGYWVSRVDLVARPISILEAISSQDGLLRNIGNVSVAVYDNAVAAAKVWKQFVDVYADNPTVEKITEKIAAPAVVATVAAATIPVMGFSSIVALLRFVFLQPLMLIGRRKRNKWGMVYNALDKLPVDLAIIRLLDFETGRVVQSRVTDQKGRYFFVAKLGQYRIEVVKNGFVFPTTLLSGMETDSEKVDLYHGEGITVDEDGAVITANIPLDPAGATVKPRRIAREKTLRMVRVVVACFGVAASLVAVYISPTWQMWTLLGVQIGISLLFARLSQPLPVRGWGIVYDATGKKPLGNVVTRLFSARFNKLVTSQVTDSRGRYYLMAADDVYFATFDKKAYTTTKVEGIDLRGKEDNVVNVDVSMKPQV
jgi:hypothetical protein